MPVAVLRLLQSCEKSLFPRNRELRRRPDVVHFRKACLVDGQGKPSARVDVNQWRFRRYITEGLLEFQVKLLVSQGQRNGVPSLVAKLQEFFSIDICDQIAEWPVRGNDFAMQAIVVGHGRLEIETDQRLQIQRWTDLVPVVATGNVCPGWRENVSPVKRRRQGFADH